MKAAWCSSCSSDPSAPCMATASSCATLPPAGLSAAAASSMCSRRRAAAPGPPASLNVELSPADLALWKKLEPQLRVLRPPSLAELAALEKVEPRKVEAVLSRAARLGMVVRVSKTRFFVPSFVKDLERMAQDVAGREKAITAAAFRDRSGIGRNLAIEVLEYFDRIRFTRRVGDAHVLSK